LSGSGKALNFLDDLSSLGFTNVNNNQL
jgi:hypothetical protein